MLSETQVAEDDWEDYLIFPRRLSSRPSHFLTL